VTKRLTFAGRFWLSYAVALVVALLWSCSARAAINDAGWTQCATSPYDLCAVSDAWVRRGQGNDYVTRWAPVSSGTFCQPFETNEYGSKGFGSRAHVAGDTCWYKPAMGTLSPVAGLGFVAGVGYPGGYVTGYVSPVCLGGAACTGSEGDPDPPDPPGSGASSPGNVSMDWSSQAHLMQAGLVGLAMVAFMLGYRSGDRV